MEIMTIAVLITPKYRLLVAPPELAELLSQSLD